MKKLLVILLLFFPVHGAWAEENPIPEWAWKEMLHITCYSSKTMPKYTNKITKSWNHQNSDRDALPLNTKYFKKHVFIDSIKPIEF